MRQMRKAKNAPPWTKKKLNRYRKVQHEGRLLEVRAAQEQEKRHQASSDLVDAKMKGVAGV